MLDERWYGILPGAEPRAVDLLYLAGLQIRVVNDELAGDRPPMLVGDVAELLPTDPENREHGLDIVHDGVRLGLLVEVRFTPILRLVVRVSLRREVVRLDELLRQRHHLERLREG